MKRRFLSMFLVGIMCVSITSANMMVFAENPDNVEMESTSENDTNTEQEASSEKSEETSFDGYEDITDEAVVEDSVPEGTSDSEVTVDTEIFDGDDKNEFVSDLDSKENSDIESIEDESDVVETEITGTIIRYEEVDDELLYDTVLFSSVNEDGVEVITMGTAPLVVDEPESSVFDLFSAFSLEADVEAPSINDNTWENYAPYYDNNAGDSHQSAADYGAWGGNGNLQGQKYDSVYNNDLSHEFKMFTDGQDVHLYIQYSAIYNGMGNGNDYNFKIDGENTKYRIVLEDGRELAQSNLEPGTYNLMIVNENGAISGQTVLGAAGQIVVKENNLHNEMEVVIPLSAMQAQNSNVNLDTVQTISFFTPNLMKGELACAGAGNGKLFFIIMSYAIFMMSAGLFGKINFLDKDKKATC